MSLDVEQVCSAAAAVIVTYNPKADEIADFVDALLDQFPIVVVADNSNDAGLRAALESALDARSIYVDMGGNHGIASAQNRGIAVATQAGAEYFVTLDQDSRLPRDFLSQLAQGFVEARTLGPIAAVGPRAVDAETGENYVPALSSHGLNVVQTTLASGMLTSREALNAVGPMDESLFIDLVDWEWCFRARSKGLPVMVDGRVSLEHRLGERHTRIPLVGRIGTPQPLRHYYAFRNHLTLCRRDYVPLRWKLKYLVINLFKLVCYPLFMARGGERLGHMMAGIRDGLAGTVGPR